MMKKTSKDFKVYELPKEFKGLIIFFILFSTYCLIAGEHGLRGPTGTYTMFILSWAIFLLQIYKIELVNDERIIFYRVIKNTEVKIKNIKAFVEGVRYFRLYHTHGTLFLDHFISNLTSFRRTVQKLNPEITSETISLKNFHKDWWGLGMLSHVIFISIVFIFVFYLVGTHLWSVFIK